MLSVNGAAAIRGIQLSRRTVFDDIRKLQHDEDFQPCCDESLYPSCGAPAGSLERIAAYRWRVEHGFCIFHAGDANDQTAAGRSDYTAYVAGIRECSVVVQQKPVKDP